MTEQVKNALVVGNWKMELSHKGEVEAAKAIKKMCQGHAWSHTQVVVCPSYPSLGYVAQELAKVDKVGVGAQQVHWEDKGAWTGEVSISEIAPFVRWCIVGHSDQRRLIGLSGDQVNQTAVKLLQHGITPIVCLGETAEERTQDKTITVVTSQMNNLLEALTRMMIAKLVVTYEPVWAISANNPVAWPDPAEMASIMLLIRKIAAAEFGHEAAAKMRVLYGGSVKPSNVGEYVKEPGVDGVLVGNASIQPRQLIEMADIVDSLCT